jgi:hypothetical protein
MNSDTRAHRDHIYETSPADQVSWYRPHLETSLALIDRAVPGPDASLIDGGRPLVDDLIARGFRNVLVPDISAAAIAATRKRLGRRADRVRWISGDVTQLELPSL